MSGRKTSKFFKLGEASKELIEIGAEVLSSLPTPKMHYIGYGSDSFEEIEIQTVVELKKHLEKHQVNWINIDSTQGVSLARLAQLFRIHELSIEDVMKYHQRSKVDSFPEHIFIVLRVPTGKHDSCDTEQLSIFLGKDYLISFQEKAGGDCLNSVRDKIRKASGHIRERGADYLAYAVIDAGIDAYFPMMEKLGERIESLEESIVSNVGNDATALIHHLKLEVLGIRRSIWPMRDTINTICRDPSPFISDGTRVYLRDCYDHLSRIIDLVEMYRELATDLLNIYLSSVNNRMNEIIKVLTVITSIFIPPTFIAGVYGMNFKSELSPYNMPELSWYFGYPLSLLLMFLTALAIIVFLRRRRWL